MPRLESTYQLFLSSLHLLYAATIVLAIGGFVGLLSASSDNVLLWMLIPSEPAFNFMIAGLLSIPLLTFSGGAIRMLTVVLKKAFNIENSRSEDDMQSKQPKVRSIRIRYST